MPEHEHKLLRPTELRELGDAWADLWERCDGPVFQHPAWTLAFLRPDQEPVGHALFRDGELVALLVLVDRGGDMRVGGFPLNDANELLALDPAAGAGLLRAAVAALGVPLVIDLLAPNGPTARLLRQIEGLNVQWTGEKSCPTLPVGARPGKRLRKRFDRERRQAAIELRCSRPGADDILTFVERRGRSWAERDRPDGIEKLIELDPGFPPALAGACAELSTQGLCNLAALLVDGRVVAEDLYLGRKRAPVLYMRRYEPARPLSSPGMHLAMAVRELPEIGDIDLGRGEEPYKLRLGGRADVRVTARITA